MPKTNSRHSAFTLLELLVVMAIIALLAGLGLRTFGSIQQKSRDGRRKQDLQNITKALEYYYNDFKHYPYTAEGKIMGCGEAASQECEWGGVWQNATDQTLYMSELPQDPSKGQYYYSTDDEGTFYRIFAVLENTEDGDVPVNPSGEPGYYSGTHCRIIEDIPVVDSCNYVIMSTNLVDKPEVI